jgi:hypothetical protein
MFLGGCKLATKFLKVRINIYIKLVYIEINKNYHIKLVQLIEISHFKYEAECLKKIQTHHLFMLREFFLATMVFKNTFVYLPKKSLCFKWQINVFQINLCLD